MKIVNVTPNSAVQSVIDQDPSSSMEVRFGSYLPADFGFEHGLQLAYRLDL
jgi:hypothetical protein